MWSTWEGLVPGKGGSRTEQISVSSHGAAEDTSTGLKTPVQLELLPASPAQLGELYAT